MNNEIVSKWNATKTEKSIREEFVKVFKSCPIPDDELLSNLFLFIKRHELSNLLFINELYKLNLDVQGIIAEFGVRWGRNLGLLSALRGIYEPFNHNRKILGFDTFEGFTSVSKEDGTAEDMREGAWSTSKNYEDYLKKIMDYHEQESPISSIKKYKLIKGDASIEMEKYLKKNPQTIISLVYFDLVLYEPTLKCLYAIKDHLTKGSIVAFNEINNIHPGETLAIKKVFGLDKYKIKHSSYCVDQAYFVIGE
ncbi:MAG: crotonobetainyl-CoA--carnitine CoA-transferase [bacterium]